MSEQLKEVSIEYLESRDKRSREELLGKIINWIDDNVQEQTTDNWDHLYNFVDSDELRDYIIKLQGDQ